SVGRGHPILAPAGAAPPERKPTRLRAWARCSSRTPTLSHDPRAEPVAVGAGAGGRGVGPAEVRPLRGGVRAVRLDRLTAHLADHRPVARRGVVRLVVVVVVGA